MHRMAFNQMKETELTKDRGSRRGNRSEMIETDQGWQSNQQQQPGAANLHRGGVSHLTGFGVTVVELRPMIRQGGGIGGTGEHSGVD